MMEAGTWIGHIMRLMIAHQEDLASEARENALRAALHLERDIMRDDDTKPVLSHPEPQS